jgi:hypothetical protein
MKMCFGGTFDAYLGDLCQRQYSEDNVFYTVAIPSRSFECRPLAFSVVALMSLKHLKDTLNALELEIDIKVWFLERLFFKRMGAIEFFDPFNRSTFP